MKRLRRLALTAALFTLLLSAQLFLITAFSAEKLYTNPDTGYSVYLEDGEDLLTGEEEEKLSEEMKRITAYGNVGFVSGYADGSDSAAEYARKSYQALFGRTDAFLFLIDMKNRELRIQSGGSVYRVITEDNANTITDNVFRMASRENYYGAARETYLEAYRLLSGQLIARPMKWICNALFAILAALLLNYAFAFSSRIRMKASTAEILGAMAVSFLISDRVADAYKHEKIYDPPSKSSGRSSGGGGFSGGGSSGGGFSSGGGGHRF